MLTCCSLSAGRAAEGKCYPTRRRKEAAGLRAVQGVAARHQREVGTPRGVVLFSSRPLSWRGTSAARGQVYLYTANTCGFSYSFLSGGFPHLEECLSEPSSHTSLAPQGSPAAHSQERSGPGGGHVASSRYRRAAASFCPLQSLSN